MGHLKKSISCAVRGGGRFSDLIISKDIMRVRFMSSFLMSLNSVRLLPAVPIDSPSLYEVLCGLGF